MSMDLDLASRARRHGLRLVESEALTIVRRRCGKGFLYLDAAGSRISDRRILDRIRSLAIPPAYCEVRIARHNDAHLQAVGRDEAGRTQYHYHPDWEKLRDDRKSDRLAVLVEALPAIRRRVCRDLKQSGLPRGKVIAAVVMLIDRTHIRIGCEDYVHSGRARGAATLLKRNVTCAKGSIELSFRGKGGLAVKMQLKAPRLARLMSYLCRLPGARLFKYRDGEGKLHLVTARDVNEYLHEIAGATVTAKDFRTLAASAAAARRLAALVPEEKTTRRRTQIRAVMREIAEMLGNTPAVAERSYVHKNVVEAFHNGKLQVLAMNNSAQPLLRTGESLVNRLFNGNSITRK